MMDCLTAQTKIASYVEGELKGEERKEFLLHVGNCPNCMEELEIYYTLIEGTRQLDQGVLTTSNFGEELKEKIHRELREIIANERWNQRANFIVTFVILGLTLLGSLKIAEVDLPFLHHTVTWEEEKQHMEERMLPYMLEYPYHFHVERLENK